METHMSERRVLKADDIFGADDKKFVEVPTPEWGGDGAVVRLRTLTALEAIQFSKENSNPASQHNAVVKIVQLCSVDEEGNQLFPDVRQFNKVAGKSLKVLGRLQQAALELNGLREPTADLKKIAETIDTLIESGGASAMDLEDLKKVLVPRSDIDRMTEDAKNG
jgi:hypothetical protein